MSFAHYGNKFEVCVGGRRFSTAAKLPATFMSSVAFSAPLSGSGMKPFKGKLFRLSIDHSYGAREDQPPGHSVRTARELGK